MANFQLLYCLVLCFQLHQNPTSSVTVFQTPLFTTAKLNESVELQCQQSDGSYQYLYWYQQKAQRTMELIGYLQYSQAYPEAKFQERFNVNGDAKVKGYLTITKMKNEDSAIYFCAASKHSNMIDAFPVQ
ncbi:HVM00 protein, partial [Polypterus senegalus]|nr:HVM00 protein [Polypterus senegalus]